VALAAPPRSIRADQLGCIAVFGVPEPDSLPILVLELWRYLV